MLRRNRQLRKSGVAAIELGFVTTLFIVPMLIGIWEVGRLIHVKQLVANSAREAARLAAQGYTILSNGTQVQINVSTGTPNVQQTAYESLLGAGLTQLQSSDVTVTFAFTSPLTTGPNAGTTPSQPYQGQKGESFTVNVSIPWSKVRWTSLGIVNPSTVQYTATWQMLVDDTFTVNDTLPSW
jgi:Flp pilus assembly protein TadG